MIAGERIVPRFCESINPYIADLPPREFNEGQDANPRGSLIGVLKAEKLSDELFPSKNGLADPG